MIEIWDEPQGVFIKSVALILLHMIPILLMGNQLDLNPEKNAPALAEEFKVGVQVNLATLLYSYATDQTLVSSGFNYFRHKTNREYDLIVQYMLDRDRIDDDRDPSGWSNTIAIREKRYLKDQIGGYYYSTELRYQTLEYTDYSRGSSGERWREFMKLSRYGLGFGFGYRWLDESGTNGSVGVELGNYLIGDRFELGSKGRVPFVAPHQVFVRINFSMLGFALALGSHK